MQISYIQYNFITHGVIIIKRFGRYEILQTRIHIKRQRLQLLLIRLTYCAKQLSELRNLNACKRFTLQTLLLSIEFGILKKFGILELDTRKPSSKLSILKSRNGYFQFSKKLNTDISIQLRVISDHICNLINREMGSFT